MKRAPNQPVAGELVIYAGIYSKLYTVPDADTVLPQHSHSHPHLTILLQGVVTVTVGDDPIGCNYRAPATIKIPAHTLHTFVTLTPGCVLACIHNADRADPDGEPPIAERADLKLED